MYLKQSTAATIVLGPFLDETDGRTAETALTISQADVRLSKNAGAFAQKNNATACTHMENGYYSCPLSTTDTNTLGILDVAVIESGALPVWRSFAVVTANVWDSLFSTDKLQVDAVEISGDATAADNAEAMFDGTGYAGGTVKLGVDVVAISGDATSANNLESYTDGTTPQPVNATQLAGSATAATAAGAAYAGIVTGTAVTGTLTTTQFTTNLSEATNDHYNGRTITFTSGVLAGQQRTIADYDGATKTITVAALTDAPANGMTFFIA